MLSAYGDPETVNEALRLGADHYLQKPMNLKHLVETLTSLHPPTENEIYDSKLIRGLNAPD